MSESDRPPFEILAALVKRHGIQTVRGIYTLKIPDAEMVNLDPHTYVINTHNPLEWCVEITVITPEHEYHPRSTTVVLRDDDGRARPA